MCVAVKTYRSKLITEARHGIELVGHVSPASRGVKSRVDNGEVPNLAHQLDVHQIVLVLSRQIIPRPFESLFCQWISFLRAERWWRPLHRDYPLPEGSPDPAQFADIHEGWRCNPPHPRYIRKSVQS